MDATVAADNRFMREVNSAAILDVLRTTTSVSVAELAKSTGLSRQAVTRSLTAMQDAGLVEFLVAQRSPDRVGRPAQLVRFRAEVGHVLGIHISPTKIHAVVANMAGTVTGEARSQVEPGGHLSSMAACVDRALDTAGLSADGVWSASVATPGVVDRASGTIRMVPSIPDLVGDAVLSAVRAKLSCPIYIDNDIKLATEGERWQGDHDADGSMVFVHWGSRVGAGIILGGQLYRGASNDAGDIGFLDFVVSGMNHDESGPASAARSDTAPPEGLGAFESWVSVEEFVRIADVPGVSDDAAPGPARPQERLEDMIQAAGSGDTAVLEAIDVIAARFARGLGAVRVVLDPALVVIGGPMAGLKELLLERLRAHLDLMPLNMPPIVVSSLGRGAVVSGAIRHSLSAAHQEKLPLRP